MMIVNKSFQIGFVVLSEIIFYAIVCTYIWKLFLVTTDELVDDSFESWIGFAVHEYAISIMWSENGCQ